MSGLSGVKLHFVRTLDDANDFMRWLGERRDVLAIDTETTGFNPYAPGAAIRLIQFGDAMQGWAIPYKDWYGLVHQALRKYDKGPIVAHNLGFEMRWFARHADYQVPRSQAHDTMLMAHIINPTGPGALKTLAVQHVDPRAAAGQNKLDEAFNEHGWSWDTVPLDFQPYWSYSALDPVLTARLFEKFYEKCGPGKVYGEAYELEIATRCIVSQMEATGALIDVEYAQQKYDQLHDYAASIKAWGKETYGISIGSPGALASKFLELGATISQITPTGKPRVDKYQLELLSYDANPAIATLAKQTLAMRKAGKYASTYFQHFIEDHDENNVIHADIRTLGARTSRMSVGAPAWQQLPAGEALVRNAVIARPGNALMMSDFNQIELRILAHFSQDRDLIETFRDVDESGGDFFVNVGKDIYGDPSFNKKDPRRGLVKSVAYALLYGAGVPKMAETAGVPVSVMQPVHDGLLSRYPGIKIFMNQVIDMGRRRESNEGQGYVELEDGRKLTCDPGYCYKLVNYQIQGAAATVFKRGLVRLDMAGYGDVMILPVHDEIVLDLPADEVEGAKVEVREIIADVDYALPLSADSAGPYARWGQRYE